MQGDDDEAQLRFALPAAAREPQFREMCRTIGEQCRSRKATRAMLVAGSLNLNESELKAGFANLADAGCAPGFKLACVTSVRPSFEALVRVEDSALGNGISVRVFFDEENARRWLAW